jgi:hypothetical protein
MPWWFKRHSDATIERSIAAFPSGMAADVGVALQVLPKAQHEPTADDSIEVWISGEPVRIPYRVYFPRPDTKGLEMLSPRQRHTTLATKQPGRSGCGGSACRETDGRANLRLQPMASGATLEPPRLKRKR